MHPMHHARSSAKKWGGVPQDYIDIHDWLDESKEHFADCRHRAMRHHSEGCFAAEAHFGHEITISTGKKVPVRYICEQHIKEDCGGIIPTLADWLRQMKIVSWMSLGYPPMTDDVNIMDDPNWDKK